MPKPMNSGIRWNGCREGLLPELIERIEGAVREYAAVHHGGPVEITSGRRSLRHQAQLMAAMTDAQLTALYGAGNPPDYVAGICALPRDAGGSRDPDAVYTVLRNRREGYISRHLFGAAADISPPDRAPEKLVAALKRHGLNVLDERGAGIHCFHVSLPGTPPIMVRE